jgi:glycosyltransferase involved in cell wall biosynthesis
MAMRILHWYPDFLHGGGVANAVLGLAAAQARQGSHVVVAAAAPSQRPIYEPIDSVTGAEVLAWHPTRILQFGGQRVRLASRRDLAKLVALEPDVVHVHGEFNLDNLRVSRLFRCPVVISPHGACHPVVLAKSRRAAKRVYLAAESLLLRGHVRAFHALSPAEAEDLAAVFPGAARYCVPQGPSVLVPETLTGRATVETARGQRVRFLFVGRLDVYTKGLDILLEAFEMAACRPGATGMHLILAGPDWKGGRIWLEHRATELGIRDRVDFTGPLTGSQVAAALAGADIYVQLSRHEGFSLSVTEALLAGKPAVLSSDIGLVSYPEVASLAQVRIVRPCREIAATAMTEAAENLPQLARAACASHDILRNFFSWERVAQLHIQQYARLLRPSPHSR